MRKTQSSARTGENIRESILKRFHCIIKQILKYWHAQNFQNPDNNRLLLVRKRQHRQPTSFFFTDVPVIIILSSGLKKHFVLKEYEI